MSNYSITAVLQKEPAAIAGTLKSSTPTSAPSLVVGTPVSVKGAADQPPPDAVVALRSELRGAQPL